MWESRQVALVNVKCIMYMYYYYTDIHMYNEYIYEIVVVFKREKALAHFYNKHQATTRPEDKYTK